MTEISDFIYEHLIRGACMCEQCIDAPENPEKHQPIGHVVDVQFFKVALKNPDIDKEDLKQKFLKILKRHEGEFNKVDIFDGEEHNYIELGGFFGSQDLALMIMGFGELLGVWKLRTPNNMFPPNISKMLKILAARNGMVTIQYGT